jgi:hypothetical protein
MIQTIRGSYLVEGVGMAGGHMSWHKMPGEKQEHYEMFLVWLGYHR